MTTNGTDKAELPERYEAYANTVVRHQMAVAAERDQLAADNAKLRSDAVLHKVEMEAVTSLHKAAMEAVTSENTELRSQMQTTMLMRDKAIGERAKWEALFIGIQAQMRAFEVPAAPLVTQPAE
jgi:predicted  nucleic acid-binding Zn-ribbon protein